jgi:hypothetical protein
MKEHEWKKEIVAWAGGAVIQYAHRRTSTLWEVDSNPSWHYKEFLFRVKPEPYAIAGGTATMVDGYCDSCASIASSRIIIHVRGNDQAKAEQIRDRIVIMLNDENL